MSQLSSVPNQTPSRPFADVLAEMGKENVSYKDLLATNEWRVFRKTIIERDDYYCSKCGQSDTCWYNGTLLRFAKFYHDGKQEFPFELCRMVDKRYYLHAHHKHYILGRLPWEYSTDELTTLCNECHVQIHLDQVIQVYKQIGEVLQPLNFTPCVKCKGVGEFPEYAHIESGVCFHCNGARYYELIGHPESFWFKD